MSVRSFFPSTVRGQINESLYSDSYFLFSLEKINPLYGGFCVRVRRESDNVEQDFGFISGLVDFAGIASFCGASRGFVRFAYFQSINSYTNFSEYYFRQNTGGLQPLIYNGSNFFIYNGKYFLDFSYQISWLEIVNALSLSNNEIFSDKEHMVSTVSRSQASNTAQGIFEEKLQSNSNLRVNQYSNTTTGRQFVNYRPSGSDRFLLKSTQLSQSSLFVNTTSKDSADLYSFIYNGATEDSFTDTRVFSGDTLVGFGRQEAGNLNFRGQISEVAVWNFYDSLKLNNIIADQKSRYGIS